MKSEIKFSVITVCMNAQNNIENTIRSVIEQDYSHVDYIIKDGISSDGTKELIEKLISGHTGINFVEGMDTGIYDAMNKAVLFAKGDYVIFLNAGDTFHDSDVLTNVSSNISKQKGDIFYGDVLEKNNDTEQARHYSQKNSKLWYYSLGACLCHQAMFCKTELFKEKLFDLNFKVCADREWQMYFIKNRRLAVPLNMIIADIEAEGFSSRNVSVLEYETRECINRYCGWQRLIYYVISALKHNKLVHQLIVTSEKKISCK